MKLLAGAALLLLPAFLFAAPSDLPPIAVHRISGPIAVDGDLSDAGWREAAVIDQFWETQPADNVPPKVVTRALIGYDAKYLYIGIDARDPEPSKIRAPYVNRDEVLGTDDNIAIFLDTRNDRKSAVELRVNPRGIQGDASWNDATFTEDFSPDYFYDTAARITATGWTAEFRIPFSSLRYPRQDPQSWGIQIWRNYPRDNRYFIHSNPVPRGSNCGLCHIRTITGLSGLPEGGHLVVAPYATATQNAVPENGPGSSLENDSVEADGGLDVKWTPGSSHAIDATLNPDFSQIESDVAQIAVNQRFALFFPEKRPFFWKAWIFSKLRSARFTRAPSRRHAGDCAARGSSASRPTRSWSPRTEAAASSSSRGRIFRSSRPRTSAQSPRSGGCATPSGTPLPGFSSRTGKFAGAATTGCSVRTSNGVRARATA